MAQGTLSLAVPPGDPSREPDLELVRDAVAADIWARYHRACGHSIHFVLVVGDQAGEVEEAASRRGLTPAALADQWTAGWRGWLDAHGISCDEVVRTSDTRHERVAKALFLKLLDQGDIAKGVPEGNGCGEDQGGRGGPPAERYFLRVSRRLNALSRYLEDHPDFILPAECRDAVIRSANGRDPAISRERREWGIPVPCDRGQAIEGWFDGLLSHLTASHYLTDPQAFEQAWPPRVQIVAPEALAAHGAAPLALWMAMGLPSPERLVVRGRLRWEDEPPGAEREALGERVSGLGAEPLRYAAARVADLAADGVLSPGGIAGWWNGEIVGRLLRLVDRGLAAIESACGGQVPRPGAYGPAEEALVAASTGLFAEIGPLIERLRLRAALDAVLALVGKASTYAEERVVGGSPGEECGTPLYVLLEVCRLVAHGLRPFLPSVASAILGRLGVAEDAWSPAGRGHWGVTRPLARVPKGEPLELQFTRRCS